MPVLIEKGYHVEVTSWENDADNYDSKSIRVETIEQATLLAKFFSLFTSKNNPNGSGIGNIVESWGDNNTELDLANETIAEFFQQHPTFAETFTVTPSLDGTMKLHNTVNLSGYELFLTRVAEKIEIRYIPTTLYYDVIETIHPGK